MVERVREKAQDDAHFAEVAPVLRPVLEDADRTHHVDVDEVTGFHMTISFLRISLYLDSI